MQTLGTNQKKALILQRERKYANTWGGGSRARAQQSLQKHFFCIVLSDLFPLRFHFYALLKKQWNNEFTILPSSGP